MKGDVSHEGRAAGVAGALIAYGWWGIAVPIYLKNLDEAPVEELLVQRVVFGLPVAIGIVWLTGRRKLLRAALEKWRLLTVATVMIAANWFTFIHSVNTEQLVFASIGYYLNPIVSVGLGVFFLGERLRRLQFAAVLFGLISVGVLVFEYGLPWIPVVLALSFGFYGLLRKKAGVDVWTGLTFEMALLFPFFALFYGFLYRSGEATFGLSTGLVESVWMVFGGVMVIVPLVAFNVAANRLPLVAVGLFQYLSPSLQLGVAILLFGEAVDDVRVTALGILGIGLVLLAVDTIRTARAGARERRRRAALDPQNSSLQNRSLQNRSPQGTAPESELES